MSVDRTRDPEHPHVAHLGLDLNDLNLLTAEGTGSVRQTVESTPEAVPVLTIAAAAHEGGGRDGEGVHGLTAGSASSGPGTSGHCRGHDLCDTPSPSGYGRPVGGASERGSDR